MANLVLKPFPSIRAPSSWSFDPVSNSGFLPPSSSNNYQQGLIRSGKAYVFNASYKKLTQADSQKLQAFLNEAMEPDIRFRLPDYAYVRRGSFVSAEAVKSGSGLTNITDWTAAGSALLSVNSGQVKITNGAAAGGIATQSLTLTNGAKHLLRVMVEAGTGTAWKAGIGSASGLFDIASATGTAPGEAYITFTAGAANWVSLQLTTATAGLFIFFDQISVAPCLTVNGAAQTGKVILLSGAPASTNGVIAKGDMLQFDTDQLVKAARDGDSDSSGNIWLPIETPIRTSPTNGAGVALTAPSAKFMLMPTGQGNPASRTPPSFADFSFSGMEDIYAKAGGA